jgi:hypothetical protein
MSVKHCSDGTSHVVSIYHVAAILNHLPNFHLSEAQRSRHPAFNSVRYCVRTFISAHFVRRLHHLCLSRWSQDAVPHGCPTFFRKGAPRLLWTGSRAPCVKITVYGTPVRLNWKIVHIMEFYYQNATLLYYGNSLNKRKYYLDKNLKHKNISLSRCSLSMSRCTSKWMGRVLNTKTFPCLVALCRYHAVLPSGWVAC